MVRSTLFFSTFSTLFCVKPGEKKMRPSKSSRRVPVTVSFTSVPRWPPFGFVVENSG